MASARQPATDRGDLSRHLTRIFGGESLCGLSSGELLGRFSERNDLLAFELLVERHGPMVLSICRSVLGHGGDADDAFQATFLVLLRRGGVLREPERVEGWLRGVASRVSRRLRADRRRRQQREGPLEGSLDSAASRKPHGTAHQDLQRVLDQAIDQLPEGLRAAVLACLVEERSYAEAATRLGWTEATVRGRLARARERLRHALGGRSQWTVVGGSMSPRVMKLAHQVERAMRGWQAIRGLAGTLILLGLGGFALRAGGIQQSEPQRSGPATPPSHRGLPREPLELRPYVLDPPDLIRVEVLEALPGRPISGEHLVRPDGTISLGYYGDVHVAGLTLPEAKARIIIRLMEQINRETLGLREVDETGKPFDVPPAESKRVFVDVTAYNSKVYYVQGAVQSPGRIPCTGRESVLDALNYAGGLTPEAKRDAIRLIRPDEAGGLPQTLAVDYQAILAGNEATNHWLAPGDRIVVPADPERRSEAAQDDLRRIEQRVGRLEGKLDRLLEILDKQPRGAEPEAPTPDPS